MSAARNRDADADLAVCAAARDGRLARYLQQHPAQAHASLYRIVNDLVYQQLTRQVERQRGHRACAAGVYNLAPDCHDRHQDAVEAVLGDLLRNADRRIENLRGWLVPRLRPVTVDAHRRRRGERGAQQRPRLPLPSWLDERIGRDPWLRQLSVEILAWVGVPDTVYRGLWPLAAWADRRAAVTGEATGQGERAVADDIERVLAAMRTNPQWYERYIERPLGGKQAPLVTSTQADDADVDRYALQLVSPAEVEDNLLLNLARQAVDAIAQRLRRGEDPRTTVREVMLAAFGLTAIEEAMDEPPGVGADAQERVDKLLNDPAAIDLLVELVMTLLRDL